MKNPEEIDKAFNSIRAILAKYKSSLSVETDKTANYCLKTSKKDEKGRPIFFGAVGIRKNYVSFHLIPVYMFPELLDNISDDLRKRMQGKSCFNFRMVDDGLFKELKALTEKSFKRYKKEKMV